MRVYVFVFFVTFQLWGLIDHDKIYSLKNEFISIDDSVEKKFLSAEIMDGKLYLRVPKYMLDKTMLFVNHHDGYRHFYKQVIWSKFQNKLILESPRIVSETGVIIPIEENASILKVTIAIFPIIIDKSGLDFYWVDATKLFLGEVVEWDANFKETVITDLSYLIDATHLENELIVRTSRVLLDSSMKKTMTTDFSFFLLPQPMKPRFYDYRMGFFTEDKNKGLHRGTSSPLASIARWRIEKRDKHTKVSVPIKPITFVLSSGIPKKWQPYVRAGILDWLPAFEAAGFKNALVVKEASENHLDNNPLNSVNESVVRWGLARDVRGKEDNSGSTVSTIVDLRSGEILKADILIGTSLQSISESYFIRCAPMDMRARQFPFPDELMGKLIQSLVSHEAGHAFGIMDANHGEYAYPFEKMRDEDWLRTMGHTPSIMTYARHNYIVQPEDNVDPNLLIQKVGPMDIYGIQWAYTPFLMEEGEQLERLVRLQDSMPWYRFVNSRFETIGPSMVNEVVDNNDPINSMVMGLKNLKRVLELLPEVNHDKRDFAQMERLYGKTLDLWYREMLHVMSLIGGNNIQYKAPGQSGNVYTPIAFNVQMEAMDFLFFNLFNPPDWLTNPKCLNRIKYSTYPDMVSELQMRLLLDLLIAHRMKRLEYMENDKRYKGITQVFLSKLQSALFIDLPSNSIFSNLRKRELQSLYIDQLSKYVLEERTQILAEENFRAYSVQSKSLFLVELIKLRNLINKSLEEEKDVFTIGHLKRILMRLESINST